MTWLEWIQRRLAVLLGGSATPETLAAAELPSPEEPAAGDPKWLQLARADLGIAEYPGPAANPAIMRAWSYCDYQPPSGDETAWCSAKSCEWMERAGLPSTRAPNARSWLKWGHELKAPRLGAVAVFWRGSPTGWEGHVGLYVGPGSRPGMVQILGGNQRNKVSIQDYPVAQLLGWRWPTTGGNSRTLRAQMAGAIGDVLVTAGFSGSVVDSLPDALAIGVELKSLAAWWPWFAVAGIVVSIAARLVTIWARTHDWQTKGV
jgi:uncharacterized protein (TIGR02594 family)